ncbi:hypothetical protein E2320_014407, partial [Naja naja]
MKQLDPLLDLNLDKGPDETFIPGELAGCLASKQIKQDPEGEQAKDREGQGQESLKVRRLSHSVGRQRNSDPWDDAKIFLISFEQVPVSSKDRIGDARNPVKELLFVENEEHILGDRRSAHPDDENSPCNHPVTFPPPEGQDFVDTGPNEGECSSLDPAQKAFYKEILQDGREKGTSLDHFTAAEIKGETLQPGSPEPEGDHQTESSCGEGFVKPLCHEGDAGLENTEGTTLPRRWLWEEGQILNQHLTHISEQKHPCPECGEQFHSRPLMVKRRMIHADVKLTERQDSCPGCEKSFAHQAIDTGERPGAATMCGRRFCKWIQPSQHR